MSSILEAAQADRRPPPPKPLPADTQQVCIDLPSEEIRCYIYKPKLEIMLRKHRDVIFDVQLFKGMTYTVEADQSDFYNTRDKKIVLFKKQQKVTFQDGERLHLWVGRNFKGSLILKVNGKVLGRYMPNELDPRRYGNDPAEKPAPLLVVMHAEPTPKVMLAGPAPTVSQGPLSLSADWTPSFEPLQFSQEVRERTQSMHVVEVRPGGPDVPQAIADFFKHGGEQTAVDTSGILTRNWLLSQIAGSAAYVSQNQAWIRELWKEKFYLQRVTHKSGPRWYIVFKGNAGLRQYLSATRYGVEHAKVIAISAGAGSVAGMRHASWGAAKGAVQGGGLLALIFTMTLSTAEWLGDYEQRDAQTGKPKRDVFDLCVKVGVDVGKAVLGAAMGAAFVGFSVWAATAVAVALGGALVVSGTVLVIGTIAASVVIGGLLDLVDKETGFTESLRKRMRASAQSLEGMLPKDYEGYDKSLEKALASGAGA
jgi:hypothetical protein